MSRPYISKADLAKAFDGLVCFDEAHIRSRFQRDMKRNEESGDSALLKAGLIEQIRSMDKNTQRFCRHLMLMGYVGGWTACELDVLEVKAKARTGNVPEDHITEEGDDE